MPKFVLPAIIVCGFVIYFFVSSPFKPGKTDGKKDLQRIRVGALYTGDSYLLVHAQAEGFFKSAGLDLELVDFTSAAERDAAFVAGDLDGITQDLIGSSLMSDRLDNISVVSQTLGHNNVSRGFGIAKFDPTLSIEKGSLKGKTLGMSSGTIIEFLAWRGIKDAGGNPEDLEFVPVSNIHLRMTMVLEGNLDLAALPEPLVSTVDMALREKTGAESHILVDDAQTHLSHAVLSWNKSQLKHNPQLAQSLFSVLSAAAEDFNLHSQTLRAKVAERCRVKGAIANEEFHYNYLAKQPTRELFADVQEFLVAKKKIKHALNYDQVVYQPEPNS